MAIMTLTVTSPGGHPYYKEGIVGGLDVPSLSDAEIDTLSDDIRTAQPQWLESVRIELGEDITIVGTLYDDPQFPNEQQFTTILFSVVELLHRRTQ